MKLIKNLAFGFVALAVTLTALALVGPRLAGWHVETVLSGSMEPTFSPGAIAVLKPVDADDVKVDDIVMFQTGEGSDARFVTHRVIEIDTSGDERLFIMQGDANTAPDPPIADNAIRGRYLYSVPWLGHVAARLKSPTGTVQVVSALALGWALLRMVGRPERESSEESGASDDAPTADRPVRVDAVSRAPSNDGAPTSGRPDQAKDVDQLRLHEHLQRLKGEGGIDSYRKLSGGDPILAGMLVAIDTLVDQVETYVSSGRAVEVHGTAGDRTGCSATARPSTEDQPRDAGDDSGDGTRDEERTPANGSEQAPVASRPMAAHSRRRTSRDRGAPASTGLQRFRTVFSSGVRTKERGRA